VQPSTDINISRIHGLNIYEPIARETGLEDDDIDADEEDIDKPEE
jgi:hypothetical protein